jgi:hypothetical protein
MFKIDKSLNISIHATKTLHIHLNRDDIGCLFAYVIPQWLIQEKILQDKWFECVYHLNRMKKAALKTQAEQQHTFKRNQVWIQL